MTRLLVCGDREWKDAAYVWDRLDEMLPLYGFTKVIEGCARGVDRIAGWPCPSIRVQKGQPVPVMGWAASRGIGVEHFPAEWERFRPTISGHKNPAGAIRNRQMLSIGMPGMVIAFHSNLQASHGTKDMVEIARAAGVETFVFPHSHEGYRL